MPGNKAVSYVGPGKVEVTAIEFPKLELRDGPGVTEERGPQVRAGVILRCVSTNICGSDQHMVRGRTTAPPGLVLGHEITGEVVEVGRDVEFIKKGDLVSVPFNIACGRCRTARREDGYLPDRHLPSWSGLRLRRHGRLGRRPGRVVMVPTPTSNCSSSRTRTGAGEDPRPHHAL